MAEGKEMGRIWSDVGKGAFGQWVGNSGGVRQVEGRGVRVMTISRPVESCDRLNSAGDGISRKG